MVATPPARESAVVDSSGGTNSEWAEAIRWIQAQMADYGLIFAEQWA